MTCNHCSKVISRGKRGGPLGRKSNNSMMAQLAARHKEVNMARALREEDKTTAKRDRDSKKKVKDKTVMAKVPIYSLQTKKQRNDFFDMASRSFLLLVLLVILLHLLLLVVVLLIFLLVFLLLPSL